MKATVKPAGMAFLCIVLLPWGLNAAGNAEKKYVPMRASKPAVENGEYLTYAQASGGVKTGEIHTVTEIDGATATIHVDTKTYPEDTYIRDFPKDFHDFAQKVVIDMNTGIMLSNRQDYERLYKDNDLSGTYAVDYTQNPSTGEFSYRRKMWDGYETTENVSRGKVLPGYPVFTIFTSYLNLRFIDPSDETGYGYVVEPDYVADAVGGNLHVLGREKLEVPAGVFNTIKVMLMPGDSFSRKLVGPLAELVLFWIEDAPTRRLIKFELTNPFGGRKNTYLLEKIGIRTER